MSWARIKQTLHELNTGTWRCIHGFHKWKNYGFSLDYCQRCNKWEDEVENHGD